MAVRAGLASIAALLLAGVATVPAFAQESGDNEPVYIEADTMSEDRGSGAYIARGNVEARQGDRTVTADELEYRPETGRVIARGNVTIYSADAPPQYADEVELDDQMGSGIATGFSTLMENNGRAAAAHAVRRGNGTLELRDAYYTACQLCSETGHEPTWRLRAQRVVQDTEDQMIYYENVRFEALGVPVFYAPAFAHPDPSSERRSGFLFPTVGVSSRLGLSYQQPYYWAISPYQDFTFSPRVMTNVRPLLIGEYRKRFYSGRLGFEGSITYEREIDGDGNRFGEDALRYHLFGGGEFEISDQWDWGFGVQIASDDLHIRRYDLNELYQDYPGLVETNAGRLTSQLYLQGQGQNYYAEVAGAAFQSLIVGENDDLLPVAAPMADYRTTTQVGEHGGFLRTRLNTISLTRDAGIDYRRASAQADWSARWIAPQGLVLEPFAFARADYYALEDLPGAMPADPLTSDSFGRFLGMAGAELSWPLYRPGQSVDSILEPVIQVVAASDDDHAGRIPNEDSQNVDLTESVIFATNRSPGYDLWEEGLRVTFGGRYNATFSNGYEFSAFVGQSRRLDGDPVFDAGSGLRPDDSDIVADFGVDLNSFIVNANSRIDPESGSINRLNLSTYGTIGPVTTILSYSRFDDSQVLPGPREEAYLALSTRLTDHWSFGYSVTRDLEAGVSRLQTAGFTYRDYCTELGILYARENYSYGILGPSESIQIRLTLFTLGSVGSED